MNTILFLIGLVLFHLPLTLYKDTIRRFQNMQRFNPDRAFNYQYKNGDLIKISLSVVLYFVSGLLLGLIPLIEGFGIHWLFAIIINVILSFYVIPFIAFVVYPQGTILSKNALKTICAICVIVGWILCSVATDTNVS